MKIRIDHEVLAKAAEWTAKALPSRPPVPVLGGVLIEASEGVLQGDLSLTAYDYETSARAIVDATVHDPGRVLVSAALLASVAKALPKKPVDLALDGSRLTVSCGSSRFSLPTMPVEDYPQLPAMPAATGTVEAEVFAQAVAQVVVAAGRDDTLPMLTGIRIEIDGPKLTLAATDRFRLAVRDIEWQPADPTLTTSLLVPARSLSDFTKQWLSRKPGEPAVTVELATGAAGDRHATLGITSAGRASTTRLLDAEFPAFRKLIPTTHTSTAIVEVAELTAAVKRASLVTDRVAQVVLAFTEGDVTVSAGGDDIGSAEETLPCELDGDPIVIGFNPGLVLDALGTIHTSRAQFALTTPRRPALVLPVAAIPNGDDSDDQASLQPIPGHISLLMPVRLPGA